MLIGTGPTREKVVQKALELGVQERMLILSNRTDIPQLLKCMDVFVFPSLFEGLSVTLVEAQVSGLRCVISDTIKPNNVLVESTVQVPLESSIDEWCDAILDVNRRSMSHYDISGFDMNKVVEYLAKLYKNNKTFSYLTELIDSYCKISDENHNAQIALLYAGCLYIKEKYTSLVL